MAILHSEGITDFKFSSFLTKKKERKNLGRRLNEEGRLHAVLRSKDLHNLIHLCVLSFMCALWRETKGKNFCIEPSMYLRTFKEGPT